MSLWQFIPACTCREVEIITMAIADIKKRLKKLGNKEHAAVSQRFFKTGPGEYGEGDVFIGIGVPVLRKLAGEYSDLPIEDTKDLLRSY